jgi:two-component system NtrC family sensor kinase
MEASNRLSPTDSLNPFIPIENVWASESQDREYPLPTPNTSHSSHQLPQTSPFQQCADPLRVAILLNNLSKNSQALSFFNQIPGINIVGIAEQQVQKQGRSQEQEWPSADETSSALLLNQTSPHILLDCTGDRHPSITGSPSQAAYTEIPGPYTTSLLEKFIAHHNGLEQHMAQIEKLANIGTLTSRILHDINNSLYVILGFSEILLEEHTSVTVRDQMLEVLQATKRINKMCEDLNQYARVSTSKECIPVDLTQQLEEAMKVARFSVGLENISIVRVFSPPPIILARPEEIVQIFVNLIINALQAMDGRGTLTLGAGHSDLMATISIGDTGPGISQEHIPKIFEPFYTTKPPGKGTGLGLHSVRSLVHQYGGQILVQSVLGEGTIFHLEFPFSPQTGLCQKG